MGVNKMTGIAWHTERMHRKEGDERRDKRKCKFYEKSTGKCKNIYRKCIGSAHCNYYEKIDISNAKKKEDEWYWL